MRLKITAFSEKKGIYRNLWRENKNQFILTIGNQKR